MSKKTIYCAGAKMMLCCLCAQAKEASLTEMFSSEGKQQQLYEKLLIYSPFIVAPGNKLQHHLCSACIMELNRWHTFMQKCIRAQDELIAQREYNGGLVRMSCSAVGDEKEASCRRLKLIVPTLTAKEDLSIPVKQEKKNTPKAGGTYCVAQWCSNNWRRNPKISLFRIPKDSERAMVWLTNAGREDLKSWNLETLHTKYLCMEHFTDDMFMNSNKKKLVWNAVPTQFSNRAAAAAKPQLLTAKQSKKMDTSQSSESRTVTSLNDVAVQEKIPVKDEAVTRSEAPGTSDVFMGEEAYEETLCLEPTMRDGFPCLYCGEAFLVKSNLILHQTTYHAEHRVGCEQCGKVVYTSRSEFMEHACDHHDKQQ